MSSDADLARLALGSGTLSSDELDAALARMQMRLNEALLEAQDLRNAEQRERVRKAAAEADLAETLLEYWRKQLALPPINAAGTGEA